MSRDLNAYALHGPRYLFWRVRGSRGQCDSFGWKAIRWPVEYWWMRPVIRTTKVDHAAGKFGSIEADHASEKVGFVKAHSAPGELSLAEVYFTTRELSAKANFTSRELGG